MGKLKLSEWRRAKGLSQEAMARSVGMSTSGYRQVEKNPGSCKICIAEKIADTLEVSLLDIIFLP